MQNYDAEEISVKHQDLTRYGDSIFKSVCPVCTTGILLMYRDQTHLQLLERDTCVSCGQHVRYTDIEEVRKIDNGRVPGRSTAISATA